MQMSFKDHAARSGFKMVTIRRRHQQHPQQEDDEEESITGCISQRKRDANTTDIMESTCHVGTMVRLRANQSIAVATFDGWYRPIITKTYLTYWGLYKID